MPGLNATQVSRAVILIETGQNYKYVIQILRVSKSVVHRVVKRYRQTGQYTRLAGQGRKLKTVARDDQFIDASVLRNCTLTSFEISSLAEGKPWVVADYKPETVERSQDWMMSKNNYSSGESTFHSSGSDNNISYHSEYGTGRYTGFGNQKTSQSTPMSPVHSGNETFEHTIASLATGWSLFTSSVTKAARTATESAVRYGGIATQKVSEMASTVTEKVNTRGGWSTLGGSTEQRRASNSGANYQDSGYGAMKNSTSEPYSRWSEQLPYKESVTTRNVDGQDLSQVGMPSPPPIEAKKKTDEESWDWLNQ